MVVVKAVVVDKKVDFTAGIEDARRLVVDLFAGGEDLGLELTASLSGSEAIDE